jgi:hypothetical protein
MNRTDRKTLEEGQSTDSDFENLGTGELLSVLVLYPRRQEHCHHSRQPAAVRIACSISFFRFANYSSAILKADWRPFRVFLGLYGRRLTW